MPRKKTSTAKRAKPSKPRLHPELESMILDKFQPFSNPQDLTWLWVGGRHVSKHFRCEIERIFRTVLLPETILHCCLGRRALCWDVFVPGPGAYAGCVTGSSTMTGYDSQHFTLDRFSDDHTRAFFKCEEYSAPENIVFRRLHEKQLVGAAVFSIQVREVINDTGLPDLQIDDENEEVSFDWRGMLDQLMGEEHVFNTILSQRLGWHLDTGEDTSNILETHRKLARRSRLQRECRAKYRSNILDHYVYDETLALEYLHYLRASNSRSTRDVDKEDNNNNNNNNNHLVYTKSRILSELPEGTVIYSGNHNPGPKAGSIPRGIFTDEDYCWYMKDMPPPSTVDLFSPRPLLHLSWGRRPVSPTRMIEWKRGSFSTKRSRNEDTELVSLKRSKASTC